jgi:hypothetical protein
MKKSGKDVKKVQKRKSVKNQLRDIERILRVEKNLTPQRKLQLKEQMNELKSRQSLRKNSEKIKKMKQRYKKIKFIGFFFFFLCVF